MYIYTQRLLGWCSSYKLGRAISLFEHSAHLYHGDRAAPTADANVSIIYIQDANQGGWGVRGHTGFHDELGTV